MLTFKVIKIIVVKWAKILNKKNKQRYRKKQPDKSMYDIQKNN